MTKLSFALIIASLLSSCGGTGIQDHTKIAHIYEGSWTSDTIPVGGFVIISFSPDGQVMGDFNNPSGGLAFSVVTSESTFNGNDVNLVMVNAVGGAKFRLIGQLFLNGSTLTGNMVRHDNHAHYTLSVGIPPP